MKKAVSYMPIKRICQTCYKLYGCVDTIRNLCSECNNPEDCEARHATLTSGGLCPTCLTAMIKTLGGDLS